MSSTNAYAFGDLLAILRKQRGMSQSELATKLATHRNTIGKWERGICLPESKTLVLELAKQLRLQESETRELLEASLTTISPHWLMPYQRNPFFTGREHILRQVHAALAHERSAALSQSYALSGLGGIGKTQVAIEYAYRYANEYTALFWIHAQTQETLAASFFAIAKLLHLPEVQKPERTHIVAAVTHWLTYHSDWLLIFDNVEDLELVKAVCPPARCGSLLLTSRRQALNFVAQTVKLERMTADEGSHFLLHRARLSDAPTSPTPEDRALAQAIVAAMDGLPLALDQAGAYIEATQCRLSDYLRLFASSELQLLDERDMHADHPASVLKTFSLVFEQLEQRAPAAAELLTLCAFMAPESIPEAVFLEGAPSLGATFELLAADPLAFHAAIKALLTYSLIQRNIENRTMSVHRLVQSVLRGRLGETEQRAWKRRLLQALDSLFPENRHHETYWKACEMLLPHAVGCIAELEDEDEDDIHAISLISHVATYFLHCALYTQAESLYLRALQMGEKTLQRDHLLVAEVLNGLGNLYREQGKYQEVEQLFQRTLRIREQELGTDHLLVSDVLTGLAHFYQEQGRYVEAEPLYQRALSIREQALGALHSQVASSLYNLAQYYGNQGTYDVAEPLYRRALSTVEQVLGPEHLENGYALNGLAMLHHDQGRYEEAERFYRRALQIWEGALGPQHPNVAYPLLNLGELSRELGKYGEAELLCQRALQIWEQMFGSKHILVARALYGIAECYREQSAYAKAEELYLHALQIREQALGLEHPEVAELVEGLARLYAQQERPAEAETHFMRALTIRQQLFGQQQQHVADTLYRFASFRQSQQRLAEALSLYQQALTIREQTLGSQHPKTCAARTACVQLSQHP